ncbi:hypothetical protein N9H34_00095 [bacterium]|nr:hypothetical protein [bacterium]
MIEIAAAISIASSAYRGIQNAVNAGREAHDLAQTFGKFFDAKESILEAGIKNENATILGKVFAGSSIESQAMEITAAKHKTLQMEKELREFLIWSGQEAFYIDMMEERKRIKRARMEAARRAAENKKFWIDLFAILTMTAVTGFIIYLMISAVV